MEQSKVDLFITSNRECFSTLDMQNIKARLESMPDTKATTLLATEFRNPTTMLIISIFLGELGIDRFMLGNSGLGVVKLLTAGGCGIWWLIDLFSIKSKTLQYNMKKFEEAASI